MLLALTTTCFPYHIPYVFNYICTAPDIFRISRKNKITYRNTNPAIHNKNFNNHNSILLGIIVPVCAVTAYCAIRLEFHSFFKIPLNIYPVIGNKNITNTNTNTNML